MCERCDYRDRIEQCNHIIEGIDLLPDLDASLSFRQGTESTVRGIQRAMRRMKHCTTKQCLALDNCQAAMQRWSGSRPDS
jgi:hypothetical protein